MANEELGSLSFASWVRRGMAAGIATPDAGTAGAPETPVAVHIDFQASDIPADVSLSMVGPGDIIGLDPSVIVRARPKPNDNDAEYLHFALIEFDQADIPWRYTPTGPAGNHLRPWLALVVVSDGEGGMSPPSPSQKLPILTVKDVNVLPDAREAWAWAHTQFEGKGLTVPDVTSKIEGQPGLFVSRLISPRILKANTSYLAALVPTFERGRQIGLGTAPGFDPGGTDAFLPAWGSGSTANWPLPVYYSWRFQTGSVGSFEQLARLIQPKPVPPKVGRRPIDTTNPGLHLPDPAAAATPLEVEGALQSVEASLAGPSVWQDPNRQAWIDALKQFVNTPILDGTRVVAPPLYAQWYAAQSTLATPRPGGTNPPWFYELNSDPRDRVGAGLGTTVIQREQEALLRGGWAQVGEISSINSELRSLQLGRETWIRLYQRHVVASTQIGFFTQTAKLHARVQCGTRSVCDRFDGSLIGGDLFDPAWRRWTSAWGWLGRRQGRPTVAPTGADLIDRLNGGQRPAPEPPTPAGLFTGDKVLGTLCPAGLTKDILIHLRGLGPQVLEFWGLLLSWIARDLLVRLKGDCWWLGIKLLRFAISLIRMANSDLDIRLRIALCEGTFSTTDVDAAPTNQGFTVSTNVPATLPTAPRPGGADSADGAAFRQAIKGIFTPVVAPPIPLPPAMDPATCRVSMTAALDPGITVAASILSRLQLDASVEWQPEDPLEPLFAPPQYEQPMYRPLSQVSKDWILPGLNLVPNDTAALVVTNQRFVEAYMAGLNHEMTRELLWNELPTDQRGTYFRQFWDTAGHVSPLGQPVPPEQLRDIQVLRKWSKDGALGSNSARRPLPDGSTQHLVLLVRAQLIKRYPNLIVYAAEAQPIAQGPGLTGTESHPVFYGLLNPDVAFYGFELLPEQVKGNPGWYFILQEQPGEPRFADISGATALAPFGSFAGASQAAVQTYQVPFRLGMHGSTLLP